MNHSELQAALKTPVLPVVFEIDRFDAEYDHVNETGDGFANFTATVRVYWGDGGMSNEAFEVRHTAYTERWRVIRAEDAQDHDYINADLRAGLGVLWLAAKDHIERMLLAELRADIVAMNEVEA